MRSVMPFLFVSVGESSGLLLETILSIQTQRTLCPFESRAALGRPFRAGRRRGRRRFRGFASPYFRSRERSAPARAFQAARQAQFNPLKFIAAIAPGLDIRENTFVREIKDRTAVTDKGSITADRVVCATHFPFISKHPRQLKLPGASV